MSSPLVECVPNFSEGRDAGAVREIVRSMQVPGVNLLDWSMDASHNRSVITVAGPPHAVMEAAIRAVGRAADLIDLTRQTGVHPRVGAADVVPFIPLKEISLGECASLARRAGMEIWHRCGVPVYFYEAAAMRPDRVRLQDVRRGGFEELRLAAESDSSRRPDVGGSALHPTAGACLVGARQFLIAYNIFLATDDIRAARAIARDVRESSGGLPGVKALGVMVEGRAQITMNVTDLQKTPIAVVHQTVLRLAASLNVTLAEGELIGLVPEVACKSEQVGQTLPVWARQIPDFKPEERVLEQRLATPMTWPTKP